MLRDYIHNDTKTKEKNVGNQYKINLFSSK